VVSTADGLRGADPELVALLRTMGASRGTIFRKVRCPGALPTIFSGIKIAVTYSVVGAILGEWVGASSGLGVFMLRASNSFRTDWVFASVAVTAVLSIALFGLVAGLERASLRWYYTAAREERWEECDGRAARPLDLSKGITRDAPAEGQRRDHVHAQQVSSSDLRGPCWRASVWPAAPRRKRPPTLRWSTWCSRLIGCPTPPHRFYVPWNKGWYADEGIDLEIQIPSDAAAALKQVAAGNTHSVSALKTSDDLPRQRPAGGLDCRHLAAQYLAYAALSPRHHVGADFEGKTYAAFGQAIERPIMRA
jgi:hypothetical protein